MPAYNKPVRIHGKAGSVSVSLVFETRAKRQDFIARYLDDGIPCAINSPFCRARTNILVRQSKSNRDREIGKQFSPLWRELADQLELLFPGGDDEGAFIIPKLHARSHVLSIEDRRNGVGKQVFKFAPLGSGQTFTLVAPDLSVPGISPEVWGDPMLIKPINSGIEHLTVLFPTVVSLFDFQVENSGRTVQYKLKAQSLRLFGLHSDVNDAHRAGANRLQNKTKTVTCSKWFLINLICLFLVFLLKCCNGFSLKPTGLMCDGRPLAFSLSRRLAGRGAFLRVFPFRWVLHFVFFFDSQCGFV